MAPAYAGGAARAAMGPRAASCSLIAGAAKSETDAGYKAGALGVDVLLEAVPQLQDLAPVRGVPVASIGSQDIIDAAWATLATADAIE